jgi:hypothetical protein
LQKLKVCLAGCLALAPSLSGAQQPRAGDEPAEEPEHSEFHKHVVAFFAGVAHQGARDNGLALGVEYEYRFNGSFGIGALAEHTFGDIDTWVYAVPFAYHRGPWKVYAAPGREDGEHGTESLLRLGGEYGIEAGEWEIAPQLDLDLVDGEKTWVLGVTFGKGI